MAISLGSLVLLAFAHHNIVPFRLKNLYMNAIRIIHNVLAVIVFISLPVLMVKFDLYLISDRTIPAVLGLALVGLTITGTIVSLIKNEEINRSNRNNFCNRYLFMEHIISYTCSLLNRLY